MSATVTGIAIGAALAFAALAYGFWGFILVALFVAIGALVGRIVSGKTDVSGLVDALRGRRSSS
ncbi:DUF2273 domain-containing protein [Frigoribacterium sp. 2-23]|uniref:DUF2273 domain-containing protein n=1 Tax=Frigoribacterium sp. 2-23 TaxID=3415006 RepID=UPI003C6EDDF8